MGTYTPLMVIGEAVSGHAAKVMQQLESLINSDNHTVFTMAELLYEVKKNNLYASAGHNTFKDYTSTLSLEDRKANYLTKLGYCVDVLGIPRATYEPVGITKLRSITSLNPLGTWTNPDTNVVLPLSGFIVELMTKSLTMTQKELDEYVRTLKGQVGENEMVTRKYTMLRSVVENILDPAIELSRRQIGSTHKDDEGISQDASDGACLEIIAVSFFLDPANQVLAGGQ